MAKALIAAFAILVLALIAREAYGEEGYPKVVAVTCANGVAGLFTGVHGVGIETAEEEELWRAMLADPGRVEDLITFYKGVLEEAPPFVSAIFFKSIGDFLTACAFPATLEEQSPPAKEAPQVAA